MKLILVLVTLPQLLPPVRRALVTAATIFSLASIGFTLDRFGVPYGLIVASMILTMLVIFAVVPRMVFPKRANDLYTAAAAERSTAVGG